MVSLLNNHGIRYYLSQNDALSTNYPYYLYDAYPYPTLNRFDYQQNLLYQQNAIPPEQKKSKKSKKKASGEKTSKEHVPFFDYKKEDLIQWLKSLCLEERFEIFSIKNSWLAIAFVKMYKRWSESHDTVFALLVEESKKPSHDKSSLEFGELDNHFYCRKQIPMTNPEKQVLIEKAEKEIITNLKIYDDTDFYDTIIFKEELLQDMDKVIQLFDTISEGSTFMTPCKITTDYNTKAIMLDSPLWFNSNSFQTFAAWIVSNFEKTIWARYFQNRRHHPRSSSSYGGILDFKFTLNYKKSLREFWKSLDKNKKKKLVIAANETFKNLVSDNQKINPADSSKEINKLLKSHYDSSLFAQAKESITTENLHQYFVHLLEEETEFVVIETIVMTSMDQFGTIPNLICRKLNHKLRNMLSEKIASDLILNEEREKRNNIKEINNNKKKSSKKKKNKKPLPNPFATPEEKIEQETNNNNNQPNETIDLQNLDLIVHTGDEESKTNNDSKAFVTQIKDLESQQTYDVIRARKPNETFITHNTIADASTCNDSGEEKCDSDKINLTDKIDSLTPLKEGNKEQKSNQESATDKNSSSRLIDDWLEELDNKISKSQKKKQKRKAKKKAEQEQLKAEELEKESQQTKNSEVSSEIIDEIPPQPKVEEKPKSNNNAQEKTNNDKQKPAETKNTNAKKNNHIEVPKITTTTKVEIQKPEPVKEESSIKTPTSAATTETTFDDFGFIEVKAKKKAPKEIEKEKRSKGRKDGKERRKRKDNESSQTAATTTVAASSEKKNLPRESNKAKSPQNSTEAKKSHPPAVEKTSNDKTIEKTHEPETPQRPNAGIPKVIMATNRSNLKAGAPKPLKKTVSTIAVSSLDNSAEPEPIAPLTKAMSQNSTASTATSHTHADHHHHHQSHSVPSGRKANNNEPHNHHKNHKHHPLSLTSPSLDLETIRLAKTKEFAHEFFDKKFESDIYKHVVKLTDEANKMMDYRILAYNRLDYCIKHMFPKFNIKTKIYGSCATGLALTASDVDISVEGIEAFDRNQLSEYFVKISNSLKGFKWVTENKPILTATVPILKLEVDVRTAFADVDEEQMDKNIPLDPAEKLDIEDKADINNYKIRIDLSLESTGGLGYGAGYNVHVGYKTTAFVMQMLEKYKSLYIVTMVLKEFLSTRQLLNTYQGGISSYCLVIMIVAIFQKFEDKGYMTSLKQFFNFYGEIFKPETTGITLIEADPFFPLNHLYETAPFWVIEHSTFKGKNIGQGCFSIKIIQHEFARVSRLIEHFKQRVEEIAIKNQTVITCVEDIDKIENEPELKAFLNCNILELMMAHEVATFPDL